MVTDLMPQDQIEVDIFSFGKFDNFYWLFGRNDSSALTHVEGDSWTLVTTELLRLKDSLLHHHDSWK